MEHVSLCELINALEFGTRLHISVVFLDNYGNEMTRLPFPQKIHSSPVCNHVKAQGRLPACFRCRNTVLKMVRTHKRAFGGLCVMGVYEYCQPVILNDTVVAVVFVGNIHTGQPRQTERLRANVDDSLYDTMQDGYSQEQCRQTAGIVTSYTMFLLERYGSTEKHSFDPLLDNIKAYLDENMSYDFSMAELSEIFNYDEKYLGRLFKSRTGQSIKEYCNTQKTVKAKKLLADPAISISDVAAQSGYNNVTYFNRIFKRITGLSPSQYRSKNLSGS